MKKLLLLVVLITGGLCRAQNYQCLQNGVKHYFINSNSYLRGIRIDSVKTSGTDVIYYPFHTPRGNYKVNPNLDSTGGSWLGKKVVQHADGTYIFDDIWNDSVVIKTQAKLGDSWTFYSDTTPLYYKADLIGIDTMTILGSVDSIKRILITAHNGSGIVTTDPADSFQMILSKNNGFVQVFDLYTFPYHAPDSAYYSGIDYYLDYTLNNIGFGGLFTPNTTNSIFSLLSVINPTYTQLYDWNPSDVFENSTFTISIPNDGTYPYKYYFDSIISRTTVTGGVEYGYVGWMATQHFPAFSSYTEHNPYLQYYYDTVSTTGAFIASNDLLLDTTIMPEEKNTSYLQYYLPDDTSYCLQSCLYQFIRSNIVKDIFEFDGEASRLIINHKTGLGLLYYDVNILGGDPPEVQDTTLLYYVRGGQPCGRFIDNFPINDIAYVPELYSNSFSIYPNPATDELTIKTNNTLPYTITLINMMGQAVTTIHTIKAQETINAANISAGVYNVTITDAGGNRYNEKVVVVH